MLQDRLAVAWDSLKSRKPPELSLDKGTRLVVNYLLGTQLRKMTHTQAQNKTNNTICEDNEAVVKICLKGSSQALGHLHRTHSSCRPDL